jgi:sugar phosphate permease
MGPAVITFAIGAVVGGLVGGYATDGGFSILWAAVGGVALLGAAFLLGWYFHAADEKKKREELTPEMRGVFDRMMGVERDSAGRVVSDPGGVFSGKSGPRKR